ncbi:hypothetical protein OEZ85_013772 [Tetradesmus obliquus]|uniref:IST1-like protein n=1 Tax=Tetradesmus obliquus TaxID=3088 RepID=A0ABY8U8Q4_TETOB|nr:hypothetical protein OEZ85_013772 [Tetradesmus obliquus]
MLGALKFNSAKCETTCRLCLGRIKLLKNKRNMHMKQYRKDIAELLRAGKQDYARIRVEAVIREAFTLTAYEILELYLELLAVRSSLVANSKEIPRDMVEALSSVLYAASRVPDLPELTTLHKMFAQKYGKEYVSEACSDVSCRRWMVNDNLQRCLTIEPPEPALKLETLSEIAQEYGVEWDMYRAQQDILPKDPPGGGTGVPLPCIPAASSSQAQQQQQQQIHSGYIPPVGYGQPPAAAAAPPPAAAAPPAAASSGTQQQAAAAGASGPPAGGPVQMQPLPQQQQQQQQQQPGFRMPTAEEIQRAYDAAQGPPPKPSAAAAAGGGAAPASAGPAVPPPVAPPVRDEEAAPAAAPGSGSGQAGSSTGDLAGLPGVPHSGASAAPSSGASSEYDELQKRFEALKKA